MVWRRLADNFTLGGNSDHLTSKSPAISQVAGCCPSPLAHGQMTDKKSAASMPPTHPGRGSLGEQGWLWHFQASSSWGSMLDTGLARLFPGIFEIILLPLPTIGFLLSWRLATAARGASTGISGSAPLPLAGLGQWSTRWAPGCSGPLACSPSCSPDRPGSSKRWAPLVAALPSPRTSQGRGYGGQITAWNSR